MFFEMDYISIQSLGIFRLMGDNNNGKSFGVVRKVSGHFVSGVFVKTFERLVKEQDILFGKNSSHKCHAAFHATAESADFLFGAVAEADTFKVLHNCFIAEIIVYKAYICDNRKTFAKSVFLKYR